MAEGQGPLKGKFFLNFAEDDCVNQGWVADRLTEGVYLVQVIITLEGQPSSVGRVVDLGQMGGWFFYSNAADARRHYEQIALAALEPIDLRDVVVKDPSELVDLALDELQRLQSKGQKSRASEISRLLEMITNEVSRQ